MCRSIKTQCRKTPNSYEYTEKNSVLSYWSFSRRFLKKLLNDPNILRQDPLEAILVIFGRRALIFFFVVESSWKNMKNDTTFVRMRSGDHLGDAKMSKKGTSLRRIELFY